MNRAEQMRQKAEIARGEAARKHAESERRRTDEINNAVRRGKRKARAMQKFVYEKIDEAASDGLRKIDALVGTFYPGHTNHESIVLGLELPAQANELARLLREFDGFATEVQIIHVDAYDDPHKDCGEGDYSHPARDDYYVRVSW